MAGFTGEIREYPGLVVDEFSAHTHKRGIAYFLSHAHRDHMNGIKSTGFAGTLALSSLKLYTTEITKSIIATDKELTDLMSYIEIITVNCMLSVKLWDGLEVNVTPLQTGHCPGAVMFLFEGDKGTVLYTGDFRLKVDDLRETRLYRETELIQINTLYLDTTFCHSSANSFITRESSRRIILEKTTEWLEEHKDNTVCLNFPCLGYEHIIMELYTQFGIKLNVTATKLSDQYAAITCIRDCITEENSRIRIVSVKETGQFDPKSLSIKPSAQWFVNNRKIKSECEYFEHLNFWRIQHSNHCSYTELIEFVTKLTPDRIVPIVTPVLSKSPLEAIDRLKHLLRPIKFELKSEQQEQQPPPQQQQQQQQQQDDKEILKERKPNRIKRLMSSLINDTDDTQLEPVCKKRN